MPSAGRKPCADYVASLPIDSSLRPRGADDALPFDFARLILEVRRRTNCVEQFRVARGNHPLYPGGAMRFRHIVVFAGVVAVCAPGMAVADDVSDLKAQMEVLQKQLDAVKTQLYNMQETKKKEEVSEKQRPFVRLKPDSGLTFEVGQGEIQLYGHADLSVDEVDNGLKGRFGAQGKNGWLLQEASNLSYFGIRGKRRLTPGITGLFQFETEIAYVNTPGPTSDAQIKQGLGSRNSFVGLQGSYGAVKLGKTDAPYKTSTARMDPFSSSVGDYNSIMGNSGGDNRAEFDTRQPHAVWYESPRFSGLNFNVLFSPGQNRSEDNSIVPRGEPVCAGGNGEPCGDGSFGDAWSTSLTYTQGPWYAIVAYEHHAKVNRTGDEGGSGIPGIPPPGSVGVAAESAVKVGVQYQFKQTGTTVDAIYERLHRNAPDDFNERTRHTATWLAMTQKITPADDFNLGWAHAGKTPGNPGAAITATDSLFNAAGPVDNASNMYAVGYKHHFSDNHTTWYAVFAEQKNHPGAHYDLGASGHGNVVDCHDSANQCFAGAILKAISVGITYDF
jgi:predicted porin